MIDRARRCPLCGGANDCGVAQGRTTCWCFSTPVPAEVREQLPAEEVGRACICQHCVRGEATPWRDAFARMHIRAATADDAEDMATARHSAVHRLLAGDYPHETLHQWAPDLTPIAIAEFRATHPHHGHVVVAEVDGRVHGFAALDLSETRLSDLYVSADYAQQGIGGALLAAVERLAIAHGASALSAAPPSTAEPFLAHRGYERVSPESHRPHRVAMRKTLSR